jgi:hypothetical protein
MNILSLVITLYYLLNDWEKKQKQKQKQKQKLKQKLKFKIQNSAQYPKEGYSRLPIMKRIALPSCKTTSAQKFLLIDK